MSMNEWDQGTVFSAEGGPRSERSEEGRTRDLTAKCRDFLRNFRHRNTFVYREQLRDRLRVGEKFLNVDIGDLNAFDPALVDQLHTSPDIILFHLERAARETAQLAQMSSEQEDEVDEGAADELGGDGLSGRALGGPRFLDIQVLLTGDFRGSRVNLRTLQASNLSNLISFSGIVISASRTRAKAVELGIQCSKCGDSRTIPVRSGLGGATLPRSCLGSQDRQGMDSMGSDCPLDPYTIIPQRTRFVDQQVLKVQEHPEDVPTGEMPRHVMCSIERSLVERVSPGTRINLIGIYSIYDARRGSASLGSSVTAVRNPYVRVVGLEVQSGRQEFFDPEEESTYRRLARDPEIFTKVANSIDPAIWGLLEEKKAIACLLFGGSRKRLPDGMRIRGDINVLLLGDPSAGKSQLLKYVERVAPIGVYTSGKGSSAAGLTASVVKDASGEFYLEGGSMVLADGGVACIDEFDKMREQDRVAIHEAMEQQTISIAKAGITTVLNSRTSVLAAANPTFSRFDDSMETLDQIDFQTTILSRFDLLFVVRDIREVQKDERIAAHVLNIHRNVATQSGPEPDISPDVLRRFVAYARSKCSPRLNSEAMEQLADKFVSLRKNARLQREGSIPITIRQLEAIVRISESIAKMSLSEEATVEHMNTAAELFNNATVAAAKNSELVAAVLSPEMDQEREAIMVHVNRRLGVGGTMKVSALRSMLQGMQFRDTSIAHALFLLRSSPDYELVNRRTTLRRKR